MKSMMKYAIFLVALASVSFVMTSIAAPKNPDAKGAGKGGPKSSVKQWFVQTKVFVEDGAFMALDDRSGVIGRMDTAEDGKDTHDLPVFEAVNGSPGAVVITHGSEWGEDAGQYLSDYRYTGTDRQVWTLAVTSNRANATVTLFWEGLYEIETLPSGELSWALNNSSSTLKSLSLIDLETGEITPATGKKGALNSYTFAMNGAGERLFRWVQGDVLPEDLALSSATSLRAFGPLENATSAQAFDSDGTGSAGVFPAPPSLDGPSQRQNPAPVVSEREKEK